MQCVVLAGGRGTRLKGVFGDTPKLLVPVLGVPFANLQLARLQQWGFGRITYALGYGAEQIVQHLQNNVATETEIDFLTDGETPLGTGGAIRKLYDAEMLDEVFAITYGDTLLNLDPLKLFECLLGDPLASAVLSVWQNDNQLIPSNLEFDGQHVLSYKKSNELNMSYRYVDYGMIALRREVVPKHLNTNTTSDLGELVSRLALTGEVLGYEVLNRFYEIGTLEGLSDTERYLRELAESKRDKT